MQLLVDAGTEAVTARAVAGRLQIPVGSVSYHFDSVRALLLEAAQRVIDLRTQRVFEWEADVTAETVTDSLAALIHRQLTTERSMTIVAYELYILGLRDETFRAISSQSIPLLQNALAKILPRVDAIRLAATADGYQLESLFAPEAPDLVTIQTVLRSAQPITGHEPSERPGSSRG